MSGDPFASKRTAMREEFFARHFALGGWPGATDTYKRTMWAAVPDVSHTVPVAARPHPFRD